MPGFLGMLLSVARNFSETKTKQDLIKDGYKIVLATDNDEERVYDLMRRTFFKDEPALVGCGIQLENLSDAVQRYIVGDLSEGKSALAVARDERLLGVCVSVEMLPGDDQELLRLADTADPRAATLLRFWAYMVDISGLPGAIGVPRIWDIQVLATDPAARGLGIARELTVASRELARRSGFPALCVYCTSEFSGKICRSLAMRRHMEFLYSDYRDARGRQIITPPPPHYRVCVYVEDLRGDHVSTTKKSDVLNSTGKKIDAEKPTQVPRLWEYIYAYLSRMAEIFRDKKYL